MISCLIVDDEPVARSIIRNYCSHLSFLIIAGECGNALEAKDILLTTKVDLLFLDINMPVLNGISFLSTIKNPPLVIFTTAYDEYAVTAFDLAACDYLRKPFSLERFIIAVDKAREKLSPTILPAPGDASAAIAGSCFIRSEGRLVNIHFDNCLYAEAQGNYTKVVMENKNIMTKMPLSALTELLPPATFIRVHRSFVINRTKINHLEGNRIFLTDREVPLAGAYRPALLKLIGAD